MPNRNDLPQPKPQKIDGDFLRPAPRCPPPAGPARSEHIDGFYAKAWVDAYFAPHSLPEVHDGGHQVGGC